MQAIKCNFGKWNAHAHLHDLDMGKVMAIVSVTDGAQKAISKHTIVFEHEAGQDKIEETKSILESLLTAQYKL